MTEQHTKRIYMDYASTTPVDKRVLHKMLPFFTEEFGNPHSRTHEFGWVSEQAVEQARAEIAALIGAEKDEIIFTSGATESNNLALKGAAKYYRSAKKNHIIVPRTEHKCILDTCRYLEAEEGFDVTYIDVARDGILSTELLRQTIRPETIIVSVMTINNETGVIQPVAALGEVCRSHGVLFHTDAAQAFGKIPLNVKDMKIDMLSISGHKIYGPKGIGALYVGKKPRVRLKALITGGGQERGMRSGTLPTPLIVGLGEASKIARESMKNDQAHIARLSAKLIDFLNSQQEVYINGSLEQRYPGYINASFSCIEGESMIGSLNNIAVSSGSACTSSSLEPSYVLKAMGIDEDLSHTSIRFSIGRFTSDEEIDYLIESLDKAIEKLRNMSPLWDMIIAGIDLKSIKWQH